MYELGSGICPMCGASVREAALKCAACGEVFPGPRETSRLPAWLLKKRRGDFTLLCACTAVVWAILSDNDGSSKLMGVLVLITLSIIAAFFELLGPRLGFTNAHFAGSRMPRS
jgi:hypothetical protein